MVVNKILGRSGRRGVASDGEAAVFRGDIARNPRHAPEIVMSVEEFNRRTKRTRSRGTVGHLAVGPNLRGSLARRSPKAKEEKVDDRDSKVDEVLRGVKRYYFSDSELIDVGDRRPFDEDQGDDTVNEVGENRDLTNGDIEEATEREKQYIYAIQNIVLEPGSHPIEIGVYIPDVLGGRYIVRDTQNGEKYEIVEVVPSDEPDRQRIQLRDRNGNMTIKQETNFENMGRPARYVFERGALG